MPDVAAAQRTITINGDRLSGFVLPVEPVPGDIHMEALRCRAWTIDDTKRLLLEGDVLITAGSYQFDADKAVVWINRIPSAEGLINQFALFIDRIESPRGRSGLAVAGEQVLITGSARGNVTLNVALMERERATTEPIVILAQARLAEYLKRLLAEQQSLRQRPHVQPPPQPEPFRPEPGATIEPEQLDLPESITLPEQEPMLPSLFEPQGTVHFAAERIEFTTSEDENIVTCTGGLVVEYLGTDPDAKWSRLSLTAERAVIFLAPGTLEEMTARQFDADQVYGLYLEGNVVAMADEGRYILRSPKIYYDFTTGRALTVDSILRTYSRELDVPVYARAKEMRQLAANQWQAKHMIVSTSEFATPHLSLGAEQVTVTQRPAAGDPTTEVLYIDSRDNTLRVEDMPIVFFPRFSGTVEQTPLRSVEVGTRDNDGVRILTSWDFFALTGAETPPGFDALLKVDGFTKRGAAVGVELNYDVGDAYGQVDIYAMADDGVDRTSSGEDVDRDREEFRGVALWEQHLHFTQYWQLQTQASFISDETFITTWREKDFENRREYETSLYVKRQENNTALSVLGKYELNDFISNSYLLASRQYQVDKLPEIAYRRFGDSLFNDTFTYSSEYRYTRMSFAFEKNTPEVLGVPGEAFGIDDDTQVSDVLKANGLREGWVNRLDTRHELSMPMQAGNVRIVPFVVGRVTGYDDDFEEFSSDADELRFFAAAGVRLSTQFQRIDNTVENRILDLHRLRHIVEPNATIWYGFTSFDQSDIPTYDEDVESLGDGLLARLGVRNVWQTQRGGPGRWRSVDVLTVDTDLVLDSDDTVRESPTPQFFDYRPEYSQFGDHVRARLVWIVSDHLIIQSEGTYDLDESLIARGSIGAEIRHSPVFRSYIEYRYIEASDNELLSLAWQYELTPTYLMYFRPQWDFRNDEFRSLTFRVTRRFPDFDFTVQVKHDAIRDDTTIGASFDVASF